MKSWHGEIPGPGSSQQRCFEARRMTDGRCMQIRPSPSAKGPLRLTKTFTKQILIQSFTIFNFRMAFRERNDEQSTSN